MEAVVDALAVPSFDLFAATDAGPVAIAYAAHHPEQVTRLVLWCAWACSADIMSPRMRAWRGLLDDDWELMTETCAHLALGWSGAAAGRHAAARLRENVDREDRRARAGRCHRLCAHPRLGLARSRLRDLRHPWVIQSRHAAAKLRTSPDVGRASSRYGSHPMGRSKRMPRPAYRQSTLTEEIEHEQRSHV